MISRVDQSALREALTLCEDKCLLSLKGRNIVCMDVVRAL